MKTIVGKKIGMSQIVAENGVVVPVTLVKADPCIVSKIKSEETDGYNAIQLASGQARKISKSVAGQYKDLKLSPAIVFEQKLESPDTAGVKLGDEINVSSFEPGDIVKITAKSKGKGFAGTVKKYNFKTSAKSHGGKGVIRKVGSIGSMYPQKVFRGKKMPGQLGSERVTVRNVEIALVDAKNNILAIKGAVPGPRHSVVTIRGNA